MVGVICYIRISDPSRSALPAIPLWPSACQGSTGKLTNYAMAKGYVSINVERCKGCAFCVEFCPTKVLSLSSAFNSKGYHPPHVVAPDKCSGCDLCGMYCPDFAIYGWKNAEPKPEVPNAG